MARAISLRCSLRLGYRNDTAGFLLPLIKTLPDTAVDAVALVGIVLHSPDGKAESKAGKQD